jgi:hypothetical protein
MSDWADSGSDPIADLLALRDSMLAHPNFFRRGPCPGCYTLQSRLFGRCLYCGSQEWTPTYEPGRFELIEFDRPSGDDL